METVQNFHQLLLNVYEKSKINFSGLGLLVYNDLNGLPISSLKRIDENICLPITDYNEVIEKLASISITQNKYHDGFHLLNQKLELTHLSQYIGAPIFENIQISDEYGSRYRTALYASMIPNIVCSGVLSTNYPVTIFQKGVKLDFII
jgi:DNA integrity scanning protein DisA with diadenylate cyclase activity